MSGTLTTGFAYNGAGDRVAKTVDGVTTGYVLDPAAGLTQVLQETTGGQTTSYLYGHDLLAQYDSGTWAYHLNDGLGSVRQLADSTGQVVASYSFDPFGVPLGESGGEPYGFTGEQWDASAGLVFLRARYYEPGVGRFINKDPFAGYAHIPQSLNRWVYVRNNPVGLVDPSGLQEPVPVPTPGPPVVPEGTPAPPGGPQATPTLPPGVPTPSSVQPVCTPYLCDPGQEDATRWLLNTMQQNANGPMARLIRYFLYEYDMPGKGEPRPCVEGRVQGHVIAWALWVEMVKTHAPWDFKDFVRYKASWGGEYIQMCCSQYQYEAVANIHYGYVGRAAGFGNYELKIGAGLAQYWDHLLKPILNSQPPSEDYVRRIRRGEVWLHTYYDEPEDQAGVQIGLDLYNQNVSLTPEAFCNVFNKWASQLKVPPGG